uniref:OTU domain-containing protein n=1 Tax=Babesia bovis TaxID=5865 RepID=A7AP10_BABBO|eukprot:XP_001611862.1 hypothetical protein [Babesia bovis T2Bo]
MMFVVAIIWAQIAFVLGVPRWNPLTVDQVFDVNSRTPLDLEANGKQFDKMHTMDRNTLARSLYLWRAINHRVCKRPPLEHPWTYPDVQYALHQRFAFYGMDYATYAVRGDGKCLFNTLAAGFRLSGMTADRLRHFMNENYDKHLVELVKEYRPQDDYYTPEDLMKFSLAGLVGIDPDSPASVQHFDPALFHDKLTMMEEFKRQNDASQDDENLLEVLNGVDILGKRKDLTGDNAMEIASQIHREIKARHDKVFGSNIDIILFQDLFQFKLIFLNEGMRHFNLAGLVDVCTEDKPEVARPVSLIMAQDIPVALAIMLGDNDKPI